MIETSKQALANTFFMFNKAQAYHWNVEGINFPQYHKFFGKMYEEIEGSIDTFAEQLRALGEYAPRNIEELYEHKTIDSMNVGNTVVTMVADLIAANNETINSLNKLFDLLTTAKEQGFADFVAARLDAHKKHGWMLRSILKTTGE
jgi:starvation-inducible DNA-binding protein